MSEFLSPTPQPRHSRRARGPRLRERRTLVHVRPQAPVPQAQPAPLGTPRPRRAWRFWLILTYLVLLATSHAVTLMKPPPPAPAGTRYLTVPSPTPGAPDERIAYLEWSPGGFSGAMETSSPLWSDTAAARTSAHSETAAASDIPLLDKLPWRPISDIPPVLLIHGSPGRAALFSQLAPLLADHGYRTIAVDLPGFGNSSRDISDHSMLAHSQRVLDVMNRLHIDRAHVVGWSNGGGVALHLAGAASHRLASLTLLAAVGDQAVEGSGSYTLEHAKYAIGFAAFGIPDLLPHFGRYDTYTRRTGFLRNFWDSDQRPLRAVMDGLDVPTLIVHGRKDCMLPVKAAIHHHEVVQNSSLVLMQANHFLPLTHPAQTAAVLLPFFARHDEPGNAEPRTLANLDPDPVHTGLMRLLHEWGHEISRAPWWVQAGVLSKLVLVFPTIGVLACAWLVTVHQMDYLVAFLGIMVGLLYQTGLLVIAAKVLGPRIYRTPYLGKRLARVSAADWSRRMSTRAGREGWSCTFVSRHRAASVLGAVLYSPSVRRLARFLAVRVPALVVWSLLTYGLALAAFVFLYRWLHHVTLWPFLAAALVIALLVRTVPMLVTRRGRLRILAASERARHYEYWPMWLFYLPLVPYVCWLMLKHRSITLLTCCNAGIENGGGLVGESKHQIMKRLGDHPAVLPTLLVAREDGHARVQQMVDAMRRAELSYPVILKPDAGQRGHAVAFINSPEEALAYFRAMTGRAVLQPYASGPCECGVLWARNPDGPANGLHGFIFSITRKDFPLLTGDGVRTVEELILNHPRHRRQADVFLERLVDRAGEVLAAGETIRLGVAGNHCQGTLFRDGSDLITPELTRAIDVLADGFAGGLDFGRFDLRYESDDALRRGEGFSIVELNGTTSESTNLYDPSKGVRWAYGVLFAQWRLLFQLGARRRAEGVQPMGIAALLRVIVEHYTTRSGSAVSS